MTIAQATALRRLPPALLLLRPARGAYTPQDEPAAAVVPLSTQTEAERTRIRRSNDRDQQLEREGKRSAHNQGYDEATEFGSRAEAGPQERPVGEFRHPRGRHS